MHAATRLRNSFAKHQEDRVTYSRLQDDKKSFKRALKVSNTEKVKCSDAPASSLSVQTAKSAFVLDGDRDKKTKLEVVRSIREHDLQLLDESISFGKMELSKPLLTMLNRARHIHPTLVQRDCIPHALLGRDILGVAETGSGKTYAYLLPIIERLYRAPAVNSRRKKSKLTTGDRATKVLILQPTRELVTQCKKVLDYLLSDTLSHIKHAVVYGGTAKRFDDELRRQPDIVAATPGRLYDLLRSADGVHMEGVEIVVLDEADRLLELGFREDISDILTYCTAGNRQTMLFSATMTSSVHELAALSLRNPLRIEMNKTHQLNGKLVQKFLLVRDVGWIGVEATVLALLLGEEELTSRFQVDPRDMRVWKEKVGPGISWREKTLIFFGRKVNLKRMMSILSIFLTAAQFKLVAALHGDMNQDDREKNMGRFASGEARVLLASDLAARGLDVHGISVVVNVGVPEDSTRYVHRVGRTARAGSCGTAINIFMDEEETIMQKMMSDTDKGYKKQQRVPKKKWAPIEVDLSIISTLQEGIVRNGSKLVSLRRDEQELRKLEASMKETGKKLARVKKMKQEQDKRDETQFEIEAHRQRIASRIKRN